MAYDLNSEKYGEREMARYREKYYGDILNTPEVKESGIYEELAMVAQNVWLTTFTDDSGYIYGGLGLQALVPHWKSNDPKKTKAIENLVSHLGGNWIVTFHIHDFEDLVGHKFVNY